MAEKLLKSNIFLNRLRRIVKSEQLVLSILALLVGALAGGGTILFRDGLLFIQSLFFGTAEEDLHRHLSEIPVWQLILAPTVGGLIVGVFIYKFLPDKRPHGVADVIDAASFHDARMSTRCGIKVQLPVRCRWAVVRRSVVKGRSSIWGRRSGRGLRGYFICGVRRRERCWVVAWHQRWPHRLTRRWPVHCLRMKWHLATMP